MFCLGGEVKTILFNMIRIAIALEIFRHATRLVLPVANAALLAVRRGLSGISCVRPCSVERKRWPARSGKGGGAGSAQCSGKRVDHTYSCHFLPIPSRHVFCCLHLPRPVFCGNQHWSHAILQRTTEGDTSTFIWLTLPCITCWAVQGRNVIVWEGHCKVCILPCLLSFSCNSSIITIIIISVRVYLHATLTAQRPFVKPEQNTDTTEIHKIRHKLVIGCLLLFLQPHHTLSSTVA